jgi:hypothetical protein
MLEDQTFNEDRISTFSRMLSASAGGALTDFGTQSGSEDDAEVATGGDYFELQLPADSLLQS